MNSPLLTLRNSITGLGSIPAPRKKDLSTLWTNSETERSLSFNDYLMHSNPELSALVDLVYDGYKYPKNPATPKEYRYAALVMDGYRGSPVSVFSYAQINTGEVVRENGKWSIRTAASDEYRRDHLLAELNSLKINHPTGYHWNAAQEIKDEDTLKGEIASILERYHRPFPWYQVLFSDN